MVSAAVGKWDEIHPGGNVFRSDHGPGRPKGHSRSTAYERAAKFFGDIVMVSSLPGSEVAGLDSRSSSGVLASVIARLSDDIRKAREAKAVKTLSFHAALTSIELRNWKVH